jgi:photosynthetic reaction center cytochrome c subunit
MKIRFRPTTALAALAIVSALTISAVSAQTPQAKKTPEVYKNIQVLKDLEADQLLPAMNLIAASLGVECSFCHVANAPEKDELIGKTTARKMIAMTMELNRSAFGGRPQITCYSCHRGTHFPVPVPIIGPTDAPLAPPDSPVAADAFNLVLEKYAGAVGGTAALKKITTRVEHGNLLFGANKTPIDIYAKAPNKRVSVSHGASGDSFTAFDGKAGWLGSTGRPARDMNAIEAQDAGLDAEFALALRATEIFQEFRGAPVEKIGGRDMSVVFAKGANAPATKLYFDEQTGLLMRLLRMDDTGIGGLPVQIDYEDYREVDGIKIPFRWTLARTNGRFTIQIDSVQQNVPIDDARFTKPVGGGI